MVLYRQVIVRLVLTQNEKILLLGQTKGQGSKYCLPGGKVELDETPEEALIREVKEETGIKLSSPHLKLVTVMTHRRPKKINITFVFTADTWEGKIKPKEPEKFKTAEWFLLKGLPEKTSVNTRRLLDLVKQGVTYTEYQKKVIQTTVPPDN